MRAYAEAVPMGCAGAGRADEAWAPMDCGQVCTEAVPMGCVQAWATKGWVLEASTAGPMGCGQAGQAWASMDAA